MSKLRSISPLATDQRRSQDRLIISTAIPQITNEFNSAGDIGWYGTAYLITNCAFQLVFGKLYTFFNVKATFLTSILLFEAGSALCGAAPNSVAFILGRSIAGLGSGGILSGVVRFSFSLNTTLRQPFSSPSLLRLFHRFAHNMVP
jgi:MFS family permease